jgi:hypothetical protein
VFIRVHPWLPLAERFRTAFGRTPLDRVRGGPPSPGLRRVHGRGYTKPGSGKIRVPSCSFVVAPRGAIQGFLSNAGPLNHERAGGDRLGVEGFFIRVIREIRGENPSGSEKHSPDSSPGIGRGRRTPATATEAFLIRVYPCPSEVTPRGAFHESLRPCVPQHSPRRPSFAGPSKDKTAVTVSA